MTPTINTWINQEKTSFDNFNDFVAIRLEDGIFRSLAEKQANDIKEKKSSTVVLPWGTYTADVKAAGETGNITPAFEPSKQFKKLLNDDAAVSRDLRQESFDPDYVKLFKEYVAYGAFNVENANDAPAHEKGLRLTDDEVDYFLNSYMDVLVTIAKDKQRAGKVYRLEIDEGFPHGAFDFEYSEDGKDEEIKVKFVPSKVYKQYLKNDEIANRVRDADFVQAAAIASQLVPMMKRRSFLRNRRH